jgi:tetratricopeptide (TPR) repeat protein
MTVQEAIQAGVQAHQSGDLRRAETFYREILKVAPNHPDALHLLGMVALHSERYKEAVDLIGRSVRIATNMPSFHFDLGMALAGDGQLGAAVEAYRRAVILDPKFAEAWARLGDVLYESGQLDPAESAAKRALELRIDLADAHNVLGKVMHAKGELEQAHLSLRQAVAIWPDYGEACNNLGEALKDLGQWDEAIFWCRRALKLSPNFALAHWNLGLMLLRQGDMENGWPEYEWRWRTGKLFMPYKQPRWEGGDLNGKHLFLHAEQAMGDTIQCVRYVPQLAERVKNLTVAVQPELTGLFRGQDMQATWVTWGDPLPEFDAHCPLLSLPGLFKTTLATVPADVPYIRAAPAAVEQWRRRMPADGRRKVGLVWAGGPKPPGRSVTPAMLAALAEIGNVWFCSLQKGEAAKLRLQGPIEMADWMDEVKDFSDTAALIENLDLVISVDTAVAHLAGAMGKPVWMLLTFVPDWRWMLDRSDSPWYPTMRLFRQPSLGDWDTPIRQAAEALAELKKA